jgi:hypothetical protein
MMNDANKEAVKNLRDSAGAKGDLGTVALCNAALSLGAPDLVRRAIAAARAVGL